MSDQPICKVCGFPLDQHSLELRWGVAQAIVRGADGKALHHCSEAAADLNHIQGRIASLETVVRALRWHAGRLRTKNRVWASDDLVTHSDKLARDLHQLLIVIHKHYRWAQE